ncbi:MAG: type I-U CRISPR-associated protein Csb2 [Myxococcota bacterium]
MFAFIIEYLTGRAAATDHTRYGAPEWPPHPARLFYALVATHHETSPESAMPLEQQLLQWLEQQSPPELYASRAWPRGSSDVRQREQPPTHYVPINDVSGDQEGALPEKRSRKARTFPSVTPEHPQVVLNYPHAELPEALQLPLFNLLLRVSYLGHASSLVSLRFVTQPSELEPLHREPPLFECWLPDQASGQQLMRVPSVGLLLALETEFARTYPPELSSLNESAPRSRSTRAAQPSYAPRGVLPACEVRYRVPSPELEVSQPVQSVFRELVIFQGVSTPDVYLQAFHAVTRIFRDAALYHARQPNALLSGHAPGGPPLERPHVAFLALPDVGHTHARGRIMGIAAALPRDMSVVERREVLAALAGIEQLTLGRAGVWEVERCIEDPELQGLQRETWSRPSTEWATVTPIVLDRFPKDNSPFGNDARDSVKRACEHIGLPLPAQVELAHHSKILGVPPTDQFERLSTRNRGDLLHVHAYLRFEQPLQGPLLLGAGRYQGYGLCRPIGGKHL